MKKRQIQNTTVVVAALGATLASVYMNTNWFSEEKQVALQRCYHVVRAGKNDCATSKHACASQAITDNSPEEFIMVPKGLCDHITGGRSA